jgi:aspartate racemase
MKILGLVGGIGPESTIAYYRAIIAAGRAVAPERGQPPVLINSIDVQRILRLVGEGAACAGHGRHRVDRVKHAAYRF